MSKLVDSVCGVVTAVAVGAALLSVHPVAAPSAFAQSSNTQSECGAAPAPTTQKRRAAGILGALGEGAVDLGLRKAGIQGDYGFRSNVRAFLTDAIACSLSQREQQQAAESEVSALNSGASGAGSRRSWRSNERQGVSGGSEVVQRTSDSNGTCAVTRTFVTNEKGEEVAVRRRRCQLADGSWNDGVPA
jgi:surface antigen